MILVAIGSNLLGESGQHPFLTCTAALDALSRLPGLRLVKASPWYLTDPIPPSEQSPYVNGAARLEGAAEPAALLARLLDLEQRAGRVRSAINAPRVLDLDLIAMGSLVRAAPDPILPHPRAHLRAFVLAPLADIAPDWVHPVTGRTAGQMLAHLPPQGIRLL